MTWPRRRGPGERLERAGIRLGETYWARDPCLPWEVSGYQDGKAARAPGRTREDAWRDARRQAEDLGVLRG